MFRFAFLLFFVGNSLLSFSQIFPSPRLSVETGAQGSLGRYAPFLMSSNRHGVFGIDKNLVYGRVAVYNDTLRKYDCLYGLDLLDRLDKRNNFYFQQAYFGFKISKLVIYGGMKEEVFGNQDPVLSSGGILWSGNAQPMPKIFLGTYDYFDVPWTQGKVQLKMGISHGWFGNKDQLVNDVYLHEKYIFCKLNVIKNVSFHFGIHHAAMWGGTSVSGEKYPSSLRDFKEIFFAKGGEAGSAPMTEVENALGNHLASYQFGLDFPAWNFDWSLYMQTFLEDKNGRIDFGFDRKNRPDGLWGVSLRNKDKSAFLRGFLVEYLHSSQQSGDPLKSGNDNYFNNGIYTSGWQYRNMTIGTPLITSPAYFHGGSNQYLQNNRVIAFNVGLIGNLGKSLLIVKNIASLNYGTVSIPYEHVKFQNFTYLGYNYKFEHYPKLDLTIDAGGDLGKLIGNNIGVRCSLKKTF